MKLAEQNILIISPEPWDHIWVSKHHYAHKLAEMGAKVVFANPPKKKWHLTHTEFSNLQVLHYPKFIKGLRKFPTTISQMLFKRKLKQIEKYCATSFDIIWSFDNSVFFDFTLMKHSFNISHIVDLNMDTEFKKAVQTSNLFLFNSRPIENKSISLNRESHFINHGFCNISIPVETEIQSKNGNLNVGYAGNLDIVYLDWKILIKTITSNPNINFHFAGKTDTPSKFEQFNNVTYHGLLNTKNLMAYYQQMNILIICYLADIYPDQLANPHKMMEYLGTGKPLLVTYTSTYKEYNEGIILMCQKNEEFLSKLKTLVSNYEHYNSEDLILKRKTIARSNTYEKQIERIEKLINET